VAIDNLARVGRCLDACRALGVSFSLDDFGTGFSSLSYLQRLPAQTIKIDKSFVRDILHDHDDLALTTAVIGLARAFGRAVIAEGVESVEHGRVLMGLGCELGQGYCIARPMPATGGAMGGGVPAPEQWHNLRHGRGTRWCATPVRSAVVDVDHDLGQFLQQGLSSAGH
jgi:EAL domain-containing protein (putative c-di-GMP-specific phosphodiesterase class I)